MVSYMPAEPAHRDANANRGWSGNCDRYYSYKVKPCDYDHSTSGQGPGRKLLSTSSTDSNSKDRLSNEHVTDPSLNSNVTPAYRRQLLPRTLNAVVLDPFNSMVKSELPKADQIMHHCKCPNSSIASFCIKITAWHSSDISRNINKCIPVGQTPDRNHLVRGLWSMVQSDVFFQNVILQISAMELEFLIQKPNTYHSENYTLESIRLLRSRIHSSDEGITNHTLAAVATMASLEVWSDTPWVRLSNEPCQVRKE